MPYYMTPSREVIAPAFAEFDTTDAEGNVTRRAGDEIPIAERFHPDLVADFVEVDPDNLPVAPEANPEPAPRVTAVTMRQTRLALLASGLLDTVSAAIAVGPREGQIEWEFADTVERDSALVQGLAKTLHLSDAEIDGLFSDAAMR